MRCNIDTQFRFYLFLFRIRFNTSTHTWEWPWKMLLFEQISNPTRCLLNTPCVFIHPLLIALLSSWFDNDLIWSSLAIIKCYSNVFLLLMDFENISLIISCADILKKDLTHPSLNIISSSSEILYEILNQSFCKQQIQILNETKIKIQNSVVVGVFWRW